jgi:DNA-binding NtrC family response regulator
LAAELSGRNPRLQVVFTSGQLAPQQPVGPLGTRSVNFLPKPFRVEALLAMVRRCLERQAVLDEVYGEIVTAY